MNDREKQLMLNYSLPTFIEQRYGIKLKQSGSNYVAPCILPGHTDNKPSFSVNYCQDSSCWLYNCFSQCGGGNIFNLVQKMESVEYPQAIKIISDITGITNTVQGAYIDPKAEEFKNNITTHSNRYSNHLYSKQAEKGLKYLYSRGLTDETIKTFNLGYVPSDEYNCRKDESYINDRISFPIYENSINDSPKVVGMCYRTLEDVYNKANWDGTKKYKLQPNTKGELTGVWRKGDYLFNYHRAYKHIKQAKCVVVVEGYMDCIALWQSGIQNVVSIMSADITDKQIESLSKLSKNVILYLDNDETGIAKMHKNINKFIELGARVRVVISPDGKDGADLALKFKFNQNDIINRVFGEAIDATTFIMNSATKRYINIIDNARRVVLETCLPLVSHMDAIDKSIFLDRLSKTIDMEIKL